MRLRCWHCRRTVTGDAAPPLSHRIRSTASILHRVPSPSLRCGLSLSTRLCELTCQSGANERTQTAMLALQPMDVDVCEPCLEGVCHATGAAV